MSGSRVVAIGLLTQRDLDRLGNTFQNIIPVPNDANFDDLLERLDRIKIEPLDHGVVILA